MNTFQDERNRKRWICYSLAAVVLNVVLIFPGAVRAQPETAAPGRTSDHQEAWIEVASLPPGDRIRVIQKDGRIVEGSFQSVSSESLLLSSRKQIRSVSLAAVRQVSSRRRASRWKAVGIGAAIGFAIAFPIGAASAGYVTDRNNPSVGTRVGFGAGLGLFGAGIGAGIGALTGGSRYQTVYRSK
jgi:hypothetical protein